MSSLDHVSGDASHSSNSFSTSSSDLTKDGQFKVEVCLHPELHSFDYILLKIQFGFNLINPVIYAG